MPLGNRIILASAGSGKTTTIVTEAVAAEDRAALVTYTNNAERELRAKCYDLAGHVPARVRPLTWFTFLLRHFVRPYQKSLLEERVKGLSFVSGRSANYVPATDIERFNTDSQGRIYSDKISRFACRLIAETDGAPVRRAEQIFDRIYIDEVQDLSGFDLDFIEHLMKSKIDVVLVGDHRQATYKTNQSARNRRYGGVKIIDKLEAWEHTGIASISIHNHSYRCVQPICDFADRFFPDAPATESRNPTRSGHDGVFLVRERDVITYVQRYEPLALRYDRKTDVEAELVYNFGESKGMTFQRTIIYPHGPLKKYLKTGRLADAGKALAKLYVGVTRAQQSVAIVVPNSLKTCPIPGVRFFDASEWP